MGSGASKILAVKSAPSKTLDSNVAKTPAEINSMKAADRTNYYDSLPRGTRVTIESSGLGGTSQTNVLYKGDPNYRGAEWKVESGPVSSVSHFDQRIVTAANMAYGRVKVIKVNAPGTYD